MNESLTRRLAEREAERRRIREEGMRGVQDWPTAERKPERDDRQRPAV